jgi:hypothetical protein
MAAQRIAIGDARAVGLEAKERTVVEELLRDEFTFTSPLDDHINKDCYFEKCWPFSEKVKAFRIDKLFEQGDDASVRYTCETTEGRSFQNAELFHFKNGKISEITVYFGSLPKGFIEKGSAKAYAVMCTADLEKAKLWYGRLLGRGPDRTPMAEVHEWYFGDGGLQLLDHAQCAGNTKLTLLVGDLEETRAGLTVRGLKLGPSSGGDFAKVAQIEDPDGNIVTFAEPGPAA